MTQTWGIENTNIVLTVELADTAWKRFKGLMMRKEMPSGQALFLHKTNSIHTVSYTHLSNENTICWIGLSGVIYLLYAWKRKTLSAWMLWGLIGLGIGYFALMLAPGNVVRLHEDYGVHRPFVYMDEKHLELLWVVLIIQSLMWFYLFKVWRRREIHVSYTHLDVYKRQGYTYVADWDDPDKRTQVLNSMKKYLNSDIDNGQIEKVVYRFKDNDEAQGVMISLYAKKDTRAIFTRMFGYDLLPDVYKRQQ